MTSSLTVDSREVVQHPEIPQELGIPCIVRRLDEGDYIFLDRNTDPLGIERCEIGNFVQKVRSGELESQLYRCQDSFKTLILLLEGMYDSVGGLLAIYKRGNRGYFRAHVYPSTTFKYVKATEVKLSEFGIEVVHTPDFQSSLETIKTIFEQRTKPEVESTLFKRTRAIKMPVKMTNNPAVPRLMSLIPRLSEKTAILLIHKYTSIWNLIHAEEADILEVDGVGKGTVQKLKENIGRA